MTLDATIHLDVSVGQIMKMSVVKRWAIIDMLKQQSIAEHSYNVAMFATILIDSFPRELRKYKSITIQWALLHDITEVKTGDIPTPLKYEINSSIKEAELSMFPGVSAAKKFMEENWPIPLKIIRVADCLDALFFAGKYCIDANKDQIIREIFTRARLAARFIDHECDTDVMEMIDTWFAEENKP